MMMQQTSQTATSSSSSLVDIVTRKNRTFFKVRGDKPDDDDDAYILKNAIHTTRFWPFMKKAVSAFKSFQKSLSDDLAVSYSSSSSKRRMSDKNITIQVFDDAISCSKESSLLLFGNTCLFYRDSSPFPCPHYTMEAMESEICERDIDFDSSYVDGPNGARFVNEVCMEDKGIHVEYSFGFHGFSLDQLSKCMSEEAINSLKQRVCCSRMINDDDDDSDEDQGWGAYCYFIHAQFYSIAPPAAPKKKPKF